MRIKWWERWAKKASPPATLTFRNVLEPFQRQRIRQSLKDAGIRKLPFPFGSALSIVSDLDGTLRRRYDAYVGLLVGDLGLDFGDSIWLQWNVVPRRLQAAVGFGFLTQHLGLGRNAPVETFDQTRTFAENLAEFHKGNVDHFHAFLPRGPRVALLRQFEVRNDKTAIYDTGDFVQNGQFDCRNVFIFGVCVVAKAAAAPNIRSITFHDSDGKVTVFSDAGVSRLRRDKKRSILFAIPHDPERETEAVRLDTIIRVLVEVATTADLAKLDYVMLVNPFGKLMIERLASLRDRFNIETCLVTEHANLHFRASHASGKDDPRIEAAYRVHEGKIGAYNGGFYDGRSSPMFSTNADDPDSPFCVFPDLTAKLGFRFVVPHAKSDECGLDPLDLVTPSPTGGGGGIYWARRVMPVVQRDAGGMRDEQRSRQGTFAVRLSKAVAGCVEEPGRFWPLYTHLGGIEAEEPAQRPDAGRETAETRRNQIPSPYLDPAATHALQDHVFNITGRVQGPERIWFARATVHYDYSLILRSIGEHVARPDPNTVRITSWKDPTIGRKLPICPAQLYGLTFYVDDPGRAAVFLDGAPVTTLVHNPADDTGQRSVTIGECEIRFPVFDDFDPTRTAASECGFSSGVWRPDPAARSAGRLVIGDPPAPDVAVAGPRERILASVRFGFDGWHPVGSQLFAFDVLPDADLLWGILLETATGGAFYFGDARLAEQFDVAFTATYFLASGSRPKASWARVVVPFHDLAWQPGAAPGGPMPNHAVKALSVFCLGTEGAGIALRNMTFLRPRATEFTPRGGNEWCVTGAVQDGAQGQLVRLASVSDGTDLQRSDEVDQRGFFCFDRIPPGRYRVWTEHDGVEICDRRGEIVEVSSNLSDLYLSRRGRKIKQDLI